MNKIELTDMECKLIAEALTNNSVRYSCDAHTTQETNPKWSKKMSDKANAMMTLLNKFINTSNYNNEKGVLDMKEILTMGDVRKEFERLGVVLRETYKGNDYGVCEVTDEEFATICNDNDNIEGTWSNCAIRYSEGSNQGKTNDVLKINHKDIKCWFNPIELEKDEEIYKPEYSSLLEYLCNEMGCSLPKNVCALAVDLAKYNNMKLSELFKEYQE